MSISCTKMSIMATNPVVTGPTAQRTAENIERIRKARGLNQRDVSARLKEIGRPMLPTVVSKIERGERRIDVDDLIAFALALNVSPVALLMPNEWSDAQVALTPAVEVSARTAWMWGEGSSQADDLLSTPNGELTEEESDAYWSRANDYHALSQPPGRFAIGRYVVQSLTSLRMAIEKLTRASRQESDKVVADSLEAVELWLERLQSEARSLVQQRSTLEER